MIQVWNNFLMLILILISITINFIFLNYLDKLDKMKCLCADNWRKKYIQIYSTILIVSQATILLSSYTRLARFILKHRKIFLRLVGLYQIAGLFYIYTLYSYSKNLKKIDCKCSEKWERTLMHHYSLVILFVYTTIFIINSIVMLIALYMLK